MREVYFIKQNKEKWSDIEDVISGKIKKNPDELSSMYIDLVNDLSFSQTYYPKSNTTVYINHLSSQVFQKIYTTKRIEKNRLQYFFLREVPLLVYQYRKTMCFTFILFFVFIGIGVISSKYDIEFAKMFLSEEYVNMTRENIKNKDAVGVYQQGSTWGLSVYVIVNNLKVATLLFLSGVFAGIGSVFVLLNNGIMVGTFQYLFVEYGELKASLKGIWLHGTFEIFAIIIQGMCGLILGSAILFPKTYSRLHSFKIGFKNALKIFISTLPFTIVAGVIEGYVTRHALDMPLFLNILIIGGCFIMIAGYYLLYPFYVQRKIQKEI